MNLQTGLVARRAGTRSFEGDGRIDAASDDPDVGPVGQWFKPRPAYRFSAEDSIYLHPDAGGKGLGRRLLAELASQAEAVGIRKLIAVIGDSANAGSVGVHRALGFTPVGSFKSCGWKFGRWLDIVLMEKTLGDGDTTPPEAAQ